MSNKTKNISKIKRNWFVILRNNLKEFFSKKVVKISLVIILILGLLYVLRSLFFAAWVEGRPVFRLSLVKELERQGGKEVLDGLIEKTLIYKEAKKSDIKVEESEIDEEIKNIEAMLSGQGLSLDEALGFRNQTRKDLVSQIKIQKLVEKLLTSKISISDEELKDYFNKNKSLFGQNPVFESVKDQVRNQVFQQKLSEEYTSWIADLKAKAKILYFVNL